MGRRGPFLPDGQQGWYHEEHAQQDTADECFAELLHQNAFDDEPGADSIRDSRGGAEAGLRAGELSRFSCSATLPRRFPPAGPPWPNGPPQREPSEAGSKSKGGPQPPFAAFGQCVGAADVARPPMDFRPPEVGAGDGGKGLDGTTGGLEKLPA